MSLVVELPEPLNQELRGEASREGVSLTDHASLLLCIAAAFHDLGKAETPFQQAIKAFSEAHEVDPRGLALLVDHLIEFCQASRGEERPELLPSSLAHSVGESREMNLDLLLILRNWREGVVHGPIDISPEVLLMHLTQESLLQKMGRATREEYQPGEKAPVEDVGAHWPDGFFETTYGSLSENPVERLPQGQYVNRDEIE